MEGTRDARKTTSPPSPHIIIDIYANKTIYLAKKEKRDTIAFLQ